MASPAELTLALLAGSMNQVNGSTGWKGTYATVPNTIDNVVTLFDSDPQLDYRVPRSPYWYRKHHGLMLHVRSKEYGAGWTKINDVVSTLLSVSYLTEIGIGSGTGTIFGGYFLKSGPSPGGQPREEINIRYFFSANLTTLIGSIP